MQHSGRVEVTDVTGPGRGCRRPVKQWRIFFGDHDCYEALLFAQHRLSPPQIPFRTYLSLLFAFQKLRSAEGEKDRNLSGFRLGFRFRLPIIARLRAIRTG